MRHMTSMAMTEAPGAALCTGLTAGVKMAVLARTATKAALALTKTTKTA